MKKILLVSPYYKDSYANHISMGSAVKIANNLSRFYSVRVLTTGRKDKNETANSRLQVISTPGWLIPDPVNYMISPQILMEFNRQLEEFKPDLIIVSKYMFFSSLAIPIAKARGFKVITVTDTFPGINWFSASRLTSAIMWLYARIIGIPLLRLSDKVVLLYPGLEDIAQKYRLDYITIPNGVDSEYFQKLSKPKDISKPKNEFWVGFVGRPESAKGYEVAQQIADNFLDQKQVKFIFVGDPYASGPVNNRIYLGFRKDVMNIYQLFDCLILPSRAEGLPNVVMEAMSQGVPVIASSVGGVRYLINSTNGILVTPQSINEFTAGIAKLLSDRNLGNKLGRNGKNTISDKYNWEKIINNYQNLIEKLCAE
jgi:glycosyltransferase involved in cell wall biosynthesis